MQTNGKMNNETLSDNASWLPDFNELVIMNKAVRGLL